MKVYQGIGEENKWEIEISRSRFVCEVFPVKTQDEAEATLDYIRQSYKDATHHCFAYIVGEHGITMRMSDDGEPQGTAGAPMLEVLKKRNLSDTLAVVTRYFGGIKLGANGLVGAYSRSVAETLDRTQIVTYVPTVIAKVSMGYGAYGKVTGKVYEIGAQEIQKEFSDGVCLMYAVPEEKWSEFVACVKNATSGTATILENERKHYVFTK
ncbi:MAG: YigZ family protein [Clostridia bacterium]|nr:YigZ family protein [Clostridia bacterium]